MSAREIELQKDRARRVAAAKRRDALALETHKVLPMHAQFSAPGPAVPVPAAPGPAVPVPAAPVQLSCISIVSEIVAHPTVHHLQVGSDVQVTEAVPAEFAQYIGVVGMIRHIFVCRVNTNQFLAYIICFKSVTPAAEAMMAEVHAAGCQELIKLVPPRMLLMAMEIYMRLATIGKGLSIIGDPVTLKRKHADCEDADCEEAQELQKDKARVNQQMHSAVDLLLRVAETAMALEMEATDKEDSDKEDSDEDDEEEEVSGWVIDESDDDDDK